jgi:hypothetical protein
MTQATSKTPLAKEFFCAAAKPTEQNHLHLNRNDLVHLLFTQLATSHQMPTDAKVQDLVNGRLN